MLACSRKTDQSCPLTWQDLLLLYAPLYTLFFLVLSAQNASPLVQLATHNSFKSLQVYSPVNPPSRGRCKHSFPCTATSEPPLCMAAAKADCSYLFIHLFFLKTDSCSRTETMHFHLYYFPIPNAESSTT